jgi:pentatricopeptide repeat protein
MLQRCRLGRRQLANVVQLHTNSAIQLSDLLHPSDNESTFASPQHQDYTAFLLSKSRQKKPSAISLSLSPRPFSTSAASFSDQPRPISHDVAFSMASTSKKTLDDDDDEPAFDLESIRTQLLDSLHHLFSSPELADIEYVQKASRVAKSLGLFSDPQVVMYIARAFVATEVCQYAWQTLDDASRELENNNYRLHHHHHGGDILSPEMFQFVLSDTVSRSRSRRRCDHMDRDSWESVVEIANMAIERFPPDQVPVQVYNARLKAYIQLELFSLLPRSASSVPNADSSTYNLLIRGFLINRERDLASAVMRDMFKRGLRPDVDTYRAILSGHRGLGIHEDLDTRILSDADGLDLAADTGILNSVASLHTRARNFRIAFEITRRMGIEIPPGLFSTPPNFSSSPWFDASIQQMPDSRFGSCDGDTFAILISACVRMGKPEIGLAVFDDLRERSSRAESPVLANTSVATSLVMCHLALGDTSKAESVVADLAAGESLSGARLAPGSAPNVAVFNALLDGRLRREGLSAATDVVREMSKVGITPNGRTLDVISAHLYRRTNLPKREFPSTVRDLIRSCGGSIEPSVYQYSSVLGSLVHSGAIIEPAQRPTFDTVFDDHYLEDQADIHLLGHMRDSLVSRGTRPDAFTARAVMAYRESNGEDPAVLWSFLRESTIARGLRPEPGQILTIMRAFCDAGDAVSARQAMRLAGKFGMEPDQAYYTVLIRGFVRADDLDSAVTTFAEMRRVGINPDAVLLLRLAEGYAKVGDVDSVRAITADALAMVEKDRRKLSDVVLDMRYSTAAVMLYRAYVVRGDLVNAQRALTQFIDEEVEVDSGDTTTTTTTRKRHINHMFFMAVVESMKRVRNLWNKLNARNSSFSSSIPSNWDVERRDVREMVDVSKQVQEECKRRRAMDRMKLADDLEMLELELEKTMAATMTTTMRDDDDGDDGGDFVVSDALRKARRRRRENTEDSRKFVLFAGIGGEGTDTGGKVNEFT